MSAWDLTCRPPATDPTDRAAEEQHTSGSLHEVVHRPHNDRLAKLRHQQQQQQHQQQQVIPFALTAAAPFAWTTSEQFQALLTTATSQTINLDQTPTRGYLCTNSASLSRHVAWLEALRQQQDLARQCSAMVAAAAGAPALNIAAQQHSMASTSLLDSQCNSGQSSASSSPGGLHQRTTSSSPVESVDLTLTRSLISPQRADGVNKLQRSSSMSLSSSSSSLSSSLSTSIANSFDGDYILVSGDNIDSPTLLNSTGGGGGELSACRVDRRARKKDQNRRAAYNYRRKKMEERDRMIEEEAKLVHKHVRLAGKIARLEEKILTILSTKTRKVSDTNGFLVYHLCPVCMKSCVNIPTLRNHIKTQHHQQAVQNNKTDNTETSEMSLWAMPLGHTMSATNDGTGDIHDDDDDVDNNQDGYPFDVAKDKYIRNRGARYTMPEDDMIDRDDDSSTF